VTRGRRRGRRGFLKAPFNTVTRKRYHSINVLILGMDNPVFDV
jgi:hypothetical protein